MQGISVTAALMVVVTVAALRLMRALLTVALMSLRLTAAGDERRQTIHVAVIVVPLTFVPLAIVALIVVALIVVPLTGPVVMLTPAILLLAR